uniref:Uncharacterized protein n=1 Tax=Aegilops tauschii subsp. strangulata TaxID=200361 RepID=A0A453KLT4_AEGTS
MLFHRLGPTHQPHLLGRPSTSTSRLRWTLALWSTAQLLHTQRWLPANIFLIYMHCIHRTHPCSGRFTFLPRSLRKCRHRSLALTTSTRWSPSPRAPELAAGADSRRADAAVGSPSAEIQARPQLRPRQPGGDSATTCAHAATGAASLPCAAPPRCSWPEPTSSSSCQLIQP